MADTYYGIYQGIVTKTKDPEKRGRIKVICPDVLGDEDESAWCDPISIVAYDGGGDFCVPKKQEAVWILFIGGDPNYPVYLGGWWSEESTPLEDDYSDLDDIRIINYANCTITMKEGNLVIEVGSNSITIDDDGIHLEGNVNIEGDIEIKSANFKNLTVENLTVENKAILNTVSSGSIQNTGTIQSNQFTGNTLSVSSVETTDVNANGSIKGSSVGTNSIDLATHKHSGVTSGSDITDVAQ